MAETTERESREMAEEYPGETGCWLYRCAHAEVPTRGGPHTRRSPHAEVPTRRRTEKEANACVF